MNGGEADRLGSHLTGDQLSQANTVQKETKCLQIKPRRPLGCSKMMACTARSQFQAKQRMGFITTVEGYM